LDVTDALLFTAIPLLSHMLTESLLPTLGNPRCRALD